MGRQSKRRTKMENNPRGTDQEIRNSKSLPPELLSEILLRLPFKSVARFISVSNLFSTIIRSNYFIRSFKLRSSKQRKRVLLAFTDIDKETGHENWFFFSVALPLKEEASSPSSPSSSSSAASPSSSSSASSPSSSSSSPVFLSRLACPSPYLRYHRPDYVHGLISFVYGHEQVICNPSTGKSKTLPLVKSRRNILRRYFGYDPIDEQYKVLCVTEPMFGTGMRVASNECQVLTLEYKNSWRKIQCSIPHRPQSSGLCINGVLYYFAYMGTSMMEPSLVRFEVRSEEFDFVTNLPEEFPYWVRTIDPELINYEGHVAFVTHPNSLFAFDVWVLEDFEKHQWVKVSVSITPWASKLRYRRVDVRGTTPTGELIYAPYLVDDFYLAHHDRKMDDLTVVEFEENSEYEPGRFGGTVFSFLDYVESFVFS